MNRIFWARPLIVGRGVSREGRLFFVGLRFALLDILRGANLYGRLTLLYALNDDVAQLIGHGDTQELLDERLVVSLMLVREGIGL